MQLKKIWNQWVKNDDGNFGAMAAVSSLALLLMVGLAVDTRYMANQQVRLQSATDAIALHAYQSGATSPAQLEGIAKDYLLSIYSTEEADKISVANIERDGDEVLVTLSHDLDNNPAFFIPRNDADVSAASTAGSSGNRINFSLVLDTTASMRKNGRIQSLMAAGNRLVDHLETVNNDQFRVSVVPFARHVNVGIANQNAAWLQQPTTGTWNGCVGSRLGAQATNPHFDGARMIGVTDECGTELLPLTGNLQAVRTRINGLVATGRTYLPAGLMWGWRTLEASEPFTEAQATNVNGNQARKVMLLMTDGSNSLRQIGTDHAGDNNAATRAAANIVTINVCNAAKADGVEIYTIALQVDVAGTRELLEDCASSPAHAFDAQSEVELINAFQQIGRELSQVRLFN
ncbi:MAG: pilus assembly protein TadG-related protein [Maricaulaceae bacterium]